MIKQLTTKFLELSPAARTRMVAIKDLEKQIGDQEISIKNLKRQLDEREAELFIQTGIVKKEGDKPPTDTARKNLAQVARKTDPSYLDTLGLIETAQGELEAMKADLYEKLRDHALDKRELEAIGNLSRALAGVKDEPAEIDPQAPSAPTAPGPKKPTAAPVPIF